ncbi:MAG: RNA-binding S4 domain-containing protein, partial [Chitinophagaceae bacterium]|nr:RNA-binding S4 domain-containing protein [Chitinophagaceae bacterium]
YEVKTDEKRWVIKVTGLLPKRVQYSEAIKFYEDQTPIEEKERIAFQTASFYSGKRLSKIGRPTKKERRDIDDFMEGTE